MGLFSKSVIGLEADSKEIRAVELKGSVKKPIVTAWGKISIPEGTVKEGRIQDVNLFKVYLQKLIEENGFKGRDAVIGVNNQDVIVRFASFPKVPEDKIRNMIRFQAQEYIPIPIEELQLDYVVLDEKSNESGLGALNVLLVGARKRMLNDFIDAVTKADLNVWDIDSTMLALGRAAIGEMEDGNFALTAFNNDIGNILIFSNGYLGIARTVSFSSGNFLLSDDEDNIDNKLSNISDILLGEVKTSVSYFRSQYNQDINRFCVLGSGLNQKSVAERLSEGSGLNFEAPELYGKLENMSKAKNNTFSTVGYVAAISLAMRGLEE